MVEEEIVKEANSTGHNGKPLHGGTKFKTTIQVLCTLSQRAVDVVPN